ncbi:MULTISPECIES: NAD(P)H-dependent oxidoreductase [Prauserella salsuginis group]|uniref:NAD(P)H-dependent FMN reductase n=2 Tax=Prauserella salsuginis group TaxID=2893672 RepID=A0A839XHV3_9PSEU|nr:MULTISPECIES: NAD(P)H-dependent oxidoreductase [Prauserella salsuginis group]MBB3663552.1 NAD(P)H-dependent FMN reductase [Prauserella sediminis]MCR3720629.1 NAD(P)H-dependent FMN reductase [Prauserella flava]MCR3735290.1 NAD(P)H-dependent FMN reductase [Prauserella salsuginis]
MSVEILTLVGSLRAASHNHQLAEAAAKLAPADITLTVADGLGDLPFYNEDIDTAAALPATAARLRTAAERAHAFLYISPEYNGTMPAVIKNAIDWLSRPWQAGAMTGKPVAVIGTALGQYGGVWAHDDTRKAAGIAGGAVIDDVKLDIPGSATRFAETHPYSDAEVAEQLTKVLTTLAAKATTA